MANVPGEDLLGTKLRTSGIRETEKPKYNFRSVKKKPSPKKAPKKPNQIPETVTFNQA